MKHIIINQPFSFPEYISAIVNGVCTHANTDMEYVHNEYMGSNGEVEEVTDEDETCADCGAHFSWQFGWES